VRQEQHTGKNSKTNKENVINSKEVIVVTWWCSLIRQ